MSECGVEGLVAAKLVDEQTPLHFHTAVRACFLSVYLLDVYALRQVSVWLSVIVSILVCICECVFVCVCVSRYEYVRFFFF